MWVAPHLLQLVVVYAMVRRKLTGIFPLFLAYTVFELIEFTFVFSYNLHAFISLESYFRLFSIGMGVSTILRFGILLEITSHLFRKYSFLETVGKPVFRWIAVVLLLIGLGLAVNSKGLNSDHSLYLLFVLQRATLIMQTGLLVSLFVFSRYFNLSWRQQIFGIALGLGVYATVDLVFAAIRSQGWLKYTQAMDLVSMSAYHCSVLIWMFYLLAPERIVEPSTEGVPQHHEVEAWSQELERLLHK